MSDLNANSGGSALLNISLGDSFLADPNGSAQEEQDFLNNLDERINSKVALGMKKAVGLIVEKMTVFMQQKQPKSCTCPC